MTTAQRIDVAIQRSGIASILSLPNLADAQQLHDHLKAQGCTVGRIFEEPGEFCFFAFSLRHPIREAVARHDGYRLVHRASDVE